MWHGHIIFSLFFKSASPQQIGNKKEFAAHVVCEVLL